MEHPCMGFSMMHPSFNGDLYKWDTSRVTPMSSHVWVYVHLSSIATCQSGIQVVSFTVHA